MKSILVLAAFFFAFDLEARSVMMPAAEVVCSVQTHQLFPNGSVHTTTDEGVLLEGVNYDSWYSSGAQGSLIVILNGRSFSDSYIEYGGPLTEEFRIDMGSKLIFVLFNGDVISDRFLNSSYNPSLGSFTEIESDSNCSFSWM